MQKYKLTEEQVEAIETTISKGDRVEVIPGPGGEAKLLETRRKIIKTKKSKHGM